MRALAIALACLVVVVVATEPLLVTEQDHADWDKFINLFIVKHRKGVSYDSLEEKLKRFENLPTKYAYLRTTHQRT